MVTIIVSIPMAPCIPVGFNQAYGTIAVSYTHLDPEEAIENSEQADENQDSVQGQKDQHTIIEEVPEQSETQSADEEEKNIPKEGWYVDQNGNTYYYEYGVALENTIKEIASEDGVKAFYFDYNGIMLKDTWRQIAYLKDGTWVSGWIRADENGCLQHGWFNGDDEYYGEDYFRYNDNFPSSSRNLSLYLK